MFWHNPLNKRRENVISYKRLWKLLMEFERKNASLSKLGGGAKMSRSSITRLKISPASIIGGYLISSTGGG
jgi:hypothetical protein